MGKSPDVAEQNREKNHREAGVKAQDLYQDPLMFIHKKNVSREKIMTSYSQTSGGFRLLCLLLRIMLHEKSSQMILQALSEAI